MATNNSAMNYLRSPTESPPSNQRLLKGQDSPSPVWSPSPATGDETGASISSSLVNSFVSDDVDSGTLYSLKTTQNGDQSATKATARHEKKMRALTRMATRLKKENKALKETIKTQTTISFANSRRSSVGSIHTNQASGALGSITPQDGGLSRPPIVPPTSGSLSSPPPPSGMEMDKAFGPFVFPSAVVSSTDVIQSEDQPFPTANSSQHQQNSHSTNTAIVGSSLQIPDPNIEQIIAKVSDSKVLRSLLMRCITKQRALERVLHAQVLEKRGLLVGEVRLRDQRDELQREVDVLATQLDETHRFKEFLERENSQQQDCISRLEEKSRLHYSNPSDNQHHMNSNAIPPTHHSDPFAEPSAFESGAEPGIIIQHQPPKRIVVPRLVAANAHLSKVILALRSPRTVGGGDGATSARSSRAHTPTNAAASSASAVKALGVSPSSASVGVGFRRPSLGPTTSAPANNGGCSSPASTATITGTVATNQVTESKHMTKGSASTPASLSLKRVSSPTVRATHQTTQRSSPTSFIRARTPEASSRAPSAIAKTINSTSNPPQMLKVSRSSPGRSESASRRPNTPTMSDRSPLLGSEHRMAEEKEIKPSAVADMMTPPPSRSRSPRVNPPLVLPNPIGGLTPRISSRRVPPPPPDRNSAITQTNNSAARATLSNSPYRGLNSTKAAPQATTSRSNSNHRNAKVSGAYSNGKSQMSPASSYSAAPPLISKEKALRNSLANSFSRGKDSPDSRRISPSRTGAKRDGGK